MRFVLEEEVKTDAPSLAGAPAVPEVKPAVPEVKPAVPEVKPVVPAAPSEADIKAATEFLSKNVDGFDGKDKKPEEIMALRGAYDVWTASEARKFLKLNGAKVEDVAKMSNADAIKAATEARAKPVEYGEFVLPEGFVKYEPMDKAFKEWAGKHKIPLAAAQEIVTVHAGLISEVVNKPYELFKQTQKEWRDQVAKDPEIGGEAQNRNLASIATMINAVGGAKAAALRQALDYTGAGNHPEVIRFLFNLSKAYAEGGPLHGKGPVVLDQKTGGPAKTLYPDMPTETG